MPLPQKKLIPGFLLVLAMIALAAPPLWWSTGNPPVIDPSTAVNNKGPANIGQAKHMAKSALDAIRLIQPNIANQIEADLTQGLDPILSFAVPNPKPPEWQQKQKAPLLIGQLKVIAAPFYTRLNAAAPDWLANERITNGTNHPNSIFPWTTETTDDKNKAIANIGQLKTVFSLRFDTLPPAFTDQDGDGMDDNWELANGLDPGYSYDAYYDFDADGIRNLYEYLLGFDPKNANTNGTADNTKDRDGDGMPDAWEVSTGSLQWNSQQQKYVFVKALDWEVNDANGDFDQDGLSNAQEFVNSTDPKNWDTDSDSLPDGWEIQHGLIAVSGIQINGTWVYGSSGVNGSTGDPDADGIQNQYEYVLGFHPKNANTNGTADNTKDRDGDGIKDWQEAATGSLQWNFQQQKYVFVKALDWEVNDANGDFDQDGLSNAQEFVNRTDPKNWDTDSDSLPDGWEIQHGLIAVSSIQVNGTWFYGSSGVNGRTGDPDADGIENQYEFLLGFDPKNANTNGTADNIKDRDGDGIKDWQEAATGSLQWNFQQQKYVFVKALDWEVNDANGDLDQDGLSNAQELINSTHPKNWDTDGDYLPDGWEIQHGLIAASSIQINGTWFYGSSGVDGRTGDPDADGIENQYEYVLGFDPKNANTNGTADNTKDRDGDGIKDWQEAATGSLQWNSQQQKYVFVKALDWEVNDANGDLDQDGLSNAQELINRTDPKNWDTDGDYLPDGWEIQYGLIAVSGIQINGTWVYGSSGVNGSTGDPDADGIENQYEYVLGFDPKNANTNGTADNTKDRDGDGMKDIQETTTGSWSYDDAQRKRVFVKALDWEVNDANGDLDQDGLTNVREFFNGTAPNKWDTDGDLLPDGWEIQFGLNPLDSTLQNGANGDPDGDGLSNLDELMHGSNPNVSDSDGDGALDLKEIQQGSNPSDSTDQGQAPPAEELVEIPFRIGDPSGSHSERWKLTIQGDGPVDKRKIEFVSPNFGEMGEKTFKLRKGNKYTVGVVHVATKYEGISPDYDWEAQIDGKPSSQSSEETNGQTGTNNFFVVKDNWIVDNRQAVLTKEKHGDDENIVAGKKAYLLPVEIKVNETTEEDDDLVAVSKGTDEDLATDFSVKVSGMAGLTAELKVKGSDGGIKFKDTTLTLSDGVEAKTKLWGISPSSAKDKTIIEITLKKDGNEIGKIEEELTVFKGVKIQFDGSFYTNIDVRDYGRRPWDGRKDPKPNSKWDPVLTPPPGFWTPYKTGMHGMEIMPSIPESKAFDLYNETYFHKTKTTPAMTSAEYKVIVDQDLAFGYESAISFDSAGRDNPSIPTYRPWSKEAKVTIFKVFAATPPGLELTGDPLKGQKVRMINGKFSNIGNDGKTFVRDGADMVRLPHVMLGNYLSIQNTDVSKDTGLTDVWPLDKFTTIVPPDDTKIKLEADKHAHTHGKLVELLKAISGNWDDEFRTWKNEDMTYSLPSGSPNNSPGVKALLGEIELGDAYKITMVFTSFHELSCNGQVADGQISKK